MKLRFESVWCHRGMWLGLALLLVFAGPRASDAAACFIRGDADGSGRLDVSDPIAVFRALFLGEGEKLGCLEAADADDSGALDLADGVFVLQYLFARGHMPAAPFFGRHSRACGADPTPDELGCERYPACETRLFGSTVDAETIVFLVDRSGTMQDVGELQIAKDAVMSSIACLPAEVEIGVIFFDKSIVRFPAQGPPVLATDEQEQGASDFVRRTPGGSGQCPLKAIEETLDLLSFSAKSEKAIVYLSDGGGTCNGADEAPYLSATLKGVRAMNTSGIKIHTFQIFPSAPLNQKYLQDLAAQNGGTYELIR